VENRGRSRSWNRRLLWSKKDETPTHTKGREDPECREKGTFERKEKVKWKEGMAEVGGGGRCGTIIFSILRKKLKGKRGGKGRSEDGSIKRGETRAEEKRMKRSESPGYSQPLKGRLRSLPQEMVSRTYGGLGAKRVSGVKGETKKKRKAYT